MPVLKNQKPKAKQPDPPKKRGVGAPSSYRPEFAEQAYKLCLIGATDQEIADFFEVSTVTINNWKAKHSEFVNALKSGKSVPDERVERSLYHRAIGYTFEAEEVFQYQGQIVRAKVRKHIPPDTTACIFWLKNRRKDTWRDVHRHEHGRPGDFDQMTDTELVQLVAQEAQALLEDHSGDSGEDESNDV